MTTSGVVVPRLLRVREAAALTGIEEWRFYELLKKDKGPRCMRKGGIGAPGTHHHHPHCGHVQPRPSCSGPQPTS